jgi:hypothetical protein
MEVALLRQISYILQPRGGNHYSFIGFASHKPVNKFYSSQQRVTQSQQLEMGLTAREETQAVARYICVSRHKKALIKRSQLP